jgi:hypothetical protein
VRLLRDLSVVNENLQSPQKMLPFGNVNIRPIGHCVIATVCYALPRVSAAAPGSGSGAAW